jgi:hypothetical protein
MLAPDEINATEAALNWVRKPAGPSALLRAELLVSEAKKQLPALDASDGLGSLCPPFVGQIALTRTSNSMSPAARARPEWKRLAALATSRSVRNLGVRIATIAVLAQTARPANLLRQPASAFLASVVAILSATFNVTRHAHSLHDATFFSKPPKSDFPGDW